MVASVVEGTFLHLIPYKSLPQQFYNKDSMMGFLKTTASFQPGRTTVGRKDETYSLVSSQRSYYYPVGPSGPIPPFEYLENFERPPVDIYDQQYGAAAPGFGGILFG
jgi:hypothetical protein